MKTLAACLLLSLLAASALRAGPYSLASSDASNAFDAPVPGFVGPDGEGLARLDDGFGGILNPNNYVNPLFFGWADSVADYSPAPGVAGSWMITDYTLGAVTGDNFDIASLGELSTSQLGNGTQSGSITLTFSQPIKNLTGSDFVVFENSLGSASSVFGELAFIEVSSNGTDFARIPAVSLTPGLVGLYSQFDPTNVFNLAGKHLNAYAGSWGTPFDLAYLTTHALVVEGKVDLQAITQIRVVDIPGVGFFSDQATSLIDPATGLAYTQTHPIYDPHETFGSGGFDLEAIGVISREMTFAQWQDQRGLAGVDRGDLADPDMDGIPNLIEYATARLPDQADSRPVTTFSMDAGRLVLAFDRDERATDLVYEIEACSDLAAWTVIARSESGSPVTGVGGHAPEISETSASPLASVGVVRRVSVTDTQTAGNRRFLRLRVSKL